MALSQSTNPNISSQPNGTTNENDLRATITAQNTLLTELRAKSTVIQSAVTQVAITQLAATPTSDTSVFDIESIPISIYSYTLPVTRSNEVGGRLSIVNNTLSDKDYKIAFNIPEEGQYTVGLSFLPKSSLDLSLYKSVCISLILETSDDKFIVLIEDISGRDDSILISNDPIKENDITVRIIGSERIVCIPVSYFDVNFKAIQGIYFITGTKTLGTRGKHSFIIKSVTFTQK